MHLGKSLQDEKKSGRKLELGKDVRNLFEKKEARRKFTQGVTYEGTLEKDKQEEKPDSSLGKAIISGEGKESGGRKSFLEGEPTSSNLRGAMILFFLNLEGKGDTRKKKKDTRA